VAAILFAIEQSRSLAHAAHNGTQLESLPGGGRCPAVVVSGAIAAAVAGLGVWKLVRPESARVTKLAIAPDEAIIPHNPAPPVSSRFHATANVSCTSAVRAILSVRSSIHWNPPLSMDWRGRSPNLFADGRSIAYIRPQRRRPYRSHGRRAERPTGRPELSQAGGVAVE